MIKLNYSYTILFAATVAGVGTAADSTPTAVLWRNGSASGVSVTVSTTAQTGLYKAVFTTNSGWSAADYLELYVTATIAGTAGYLAKVWSSTEIGAVELDSATQTQIDTIESTVSSIGSQATTVERSTSDTNSITFAWPVSGATITGTCSLNNGAYGAVAGAIAFLRTETGKHYYTLAYNAADRPAAEGQVRYKFVDGTYTRYVVIRVEPDLTAAQVNAQVLDVLSVDTFAELSAPPAATSSLKDKITWLFMYARNKVTQTALARTLYRDDTTTVAGTSATSDNGTTFTKGEDA